MCARSSLPLCFAGRSELPVPMMMVSCWVPVGPQICPEALFTLASCMAKEYVPAFLGVPVICACWPGNPNCSPGGRLLIWGVSV